jgi:hypothetical protein
VGSFWKMPTAQKSCRGYQQKTRQRSCQRVAFSSNLSIQLRTTVPPAHVGVRMVMMPVVMPRLNHKL